MMRGLLPSLLLGTLICFAGCQSKQGIPTKVTATAPAVVTGADKVEPTEPAPAEADYRDPDRLAKALAGSIATDAEKAHGLGGGHLQQYGQCADEAITRCGTRIFGSAARNEKAPGTCEAIRDRNARRFCLNRVHQMIAVDANDPLKCKAIEDEAAAGACLDSVHGQVARRSGNAADCARVTDEAARRDCLTQVHFAAARTSHDLSHCRKIPDDRDRENCRAMLLTSSARKSGEPGACKGIADEAARENCRFQVIRSQAMAARDPALCKDLRDVVACRESVAFVVAQEIGSPTVCAKIENPRSRATCEMEAIRKPSRKDPGLCDQVSDNVLANQCRADAIRAMAVSQDDVGVCGGLKDAGKRQWCANNFHMHKAISGQDSSQCGKITDGELQKSCMSASSPPIEAVAPGEPAAPTDQP